MITVHVEAKSDVKQCIEKIKSFGIKAGIVLKPDTKSEDCFELAKMSDMVLFMSVYPGFGGQKFMPEVLCKARELRECLAYSSDIEIDGGINPETAVLARENGINVLVAGSSVFKSKDYASAINALR